MVQEFLPPAVEQLEIAIGQKKLGRLLLDMGCLSTERLEKALEYQRHRGGRLGWILASLGYVTRLELYACLARHFSLPFVSDYTEMRRKLDVKTAALFSAAEMLRYQAVPCFQKSRTLTVLTAEPDNPSLAGVLQAKYGVKKFKLIVVTDLDITKLSGEIHRAAILDVSVNQALRHNPEDSAYTVFSGSQLAFLAGFFAALGVWLYLETGAVFLTMLFFAQVIFAVPVLYKLALAVYRLFMKRENNLVMSIRERDLPVYTVLVPAYREKEVIANIIKSVRRLDYPPDKLDIIPLLEENDTATLEAAKAARPPANWRFLVCPDGVPRTKYKALNYGLNFARGRYAVVYDCEDLPEPDQLKKASSFFAANPDGYYCLRAPVKYFNKNENLLTRLFALDAIGLSRMGTPSAAAATRHYDILKLKEFGAWDPFNMAADADLDIRARAKGFQTGVIDSTTYAEANPQLKNWFKQHSRWQKGYLQTALVHSRRPLQSLLALGPARWLNSALLTAGAPVTLLLYPVMWALLGLALFLDAAGLFHVPGTFIRLAVINLAVFYAVDIFVALLGALVEKIYTLAPYALLLPFYRLLEVIAAYQGFGQLLTRPFYWAKTAHGVTRAIPASRTLEVPADAPELVVVKNGK